LSINAGSTNSVYFQMISNLALNVVADSEIFGFLNAERTYTVIVMCIVTAVTGLIV